MRVILVRPSSDPPTADEPSYVASELLGSVVPRIEARGLSATDLVGDEASVNGIRAAIESERDSEIVIAFAGHGLPGAWLRRGKTTLLTNGDLAAYQGLRAYAHACYTVEVLGPALVQQGTASYYLGYRSELIICYDQATLNCPQGFAETVAAGVEGVVDESSAADAVARLGSEYRYWIRFWQRKRPELTAAFRANLRLLEAVP